MAYTYEYPRPAVTADCVVITKERLRVGAKAQWFPLSALPELAFDHDEIMQDAIKKFKEVVK